MDKLKKNKDGSVTLYFGQTAPKELESNWIPTSDKAGWLVFRLYGPTDALFDRSFKLPDAKLVKECVSSRRAGGLRLSLTEGAFTEGKLRWGS